MKQNSGIGLTLLVLQNVSILKTAITFSFNLREWKGAGRVGIKILYEKG